MWNPFKLSKVENIVDVAQHQMVVDRPKSQSKAQLLFPRHTQTRVIPQVRNETNTLRNLFHPCAVKKKPANKTRKQPIPIPDEKT